MELEVRNLSVGYAREPILEGISFSVSGGETLCLLGPNGVGKTTLFRGMLGFLKPLAGSISIDGRDMGAASRGLRVPRFQALLEFDANC